MQQAPAGDVPFAVHSFPGRTFNFVDYMQTCFKNSKTLRGKHNYMNESVETLSEKYQRTGNYVQETYIDCSKLVGERRARQSHPVQYRNTTLDEVWGVKKTQ